MAAGERGSVSLAIEETGQGTVSDFNKDSSGLQVWITQAAVRGGSSEKRAGG